MEFDFRTFSPRSFERFSQALAIEILGPGVMIFGDGADGAREASYEGTLNFPSPADKWSGLTIMQAKFLQNPKTPADDANWLADQLEKDLTKFTRAGSTLKKPQYYILVSNAKLSPQPATPRGKGGIAKIDDVFKKFKRKLGLKDYKVWHYDQISTYLANFETLRRSYSAWLTTNDVISDLIASINGNKVSVGSAMHRYLMRELRSHQLVRLQQAGHSGDENTYIQNVFTDLPYKDSGKDDEADDLLLANLVSRSRDCLDRASVTAQVHDKDGRPERILILGGPGQGKSTISQFMGQIFRANILRSEQKMGVTAEVRAIADTTLQASEALGITSLPKRFPFRIDLPSFADVLSNEAPKTGKVSLLNYITTSINTIADSSITLDNLREWLEKYPSITILDGLDEVPPSANRDSVIAAIGEFWDEVVDCDTLMIVTTRPQGYNDDLGDKIYTKLEMTPLSKQLALDYAIKLADNRLRDPAQRDRVVSRMNAAARSSATSRLMVSPLQVAILLALVDQRGDAPTDRWSLFEKFYVVVLEREQGKTGPVGETMRHWGRQITALHHRAGFLLHVEAETKGKSEAYLTQEALRSLIRGQLIDEEFDGAELDRITDELLAVSTSRLVLLVQREEGRYEFEVRSLQEFMAAAYLMIGRERIVQERLQLIASRNHWLHVFQIAASKCFAIADSEHLRDTIIIICQSLNDAGDDIDRVIRTGSRLALALLDDGLAYDQPRFRRLLFRIALEVLANGPTHLPNNITKHCSVEPQKTIENLQLYLLSGQISRRNSARLLLMRCASQGQDWALMELERLWPTDPTECAHIIFVSKNVQKHPRLDAMLRQALENLSVEVLLSIPRDGAGPYSRRDHTPAPFPCLNIIFGDNEEEPSIEATVNFGGATALALVIESIEISDEQTKRYLDAPNNENWSAINELFNFHKDPSAASLASLLEKTEKHGWCNIYDKFIGLLPWPLATCLWLSRYDYQLSALVTDVRAGRFGDTEGWRKAEKRWLEHGILEIDLLSWHSAAFFDEKVAEVGAPWSLLRISHESSPQPWVSRLFEIGLQTTNLTRIYIRHILSFVSGIYPADVEINDERSAFLTEIPAVSRITEKMSPDILQCFTTETLNSKATLSSLNNWGYRQEVFLGISRENWTPRIFESLVQHLADFPGIISFIGAILTMRGQDLDFTKFKFSDVENLQQVNHPIISGYGHVLEMIVAHPSERGVTHVLEHSDESQFPLALLKQLLDGDRIDIDKKVEIATAVCKFMAVMPDNTRIALAPELRRISDQRLAELREPTCWRNLELGSTLLAQAQLRAKEG